MSVTTIRVEREVRDRLATRAATHGHSVGAELAAILDDLDWLAIEAGYRGLTNDPGALASYQAESHAWATVGLDELAATAAEEYPEYNP